MIQGEGFKKEKGNFYKNLSEKEKEVAQKNKTEDEREEKEKKGNFGKKKRFDSKLNASRECWTCGKTGHFLSDCPEEKGNAV